MKIKFKRYITGCVFLLILSEPGVLIGCGSTSDADDIGMVEMAEDDVIPAEDNSIAIEENGIPKKEAEAVGTGDSEIVEWNANDLPMDDAEIYERFLNGELTVTWKKEQVPISVLFWDNNIKYCFYDIDGDGRKELHIRDSVVYYAVRVSDDLPQILFEGWWGYEPVVFDGQCGVLHYYQGYGSESIQFMTVSADGSTQKDGEFYWSDHNKNGSMDAQDYFRGFNDWVEITMEQYTQYRDGQLAKLAENELEWKERPIKNFTTWREAYADYIKRRENIGQMSGYDRYALIYVDEDEIPELYMDTGGMAIGEFVVSYYDGHMGVMNRERVGLQYMEHGGLLYSESGNMGFYPCNIYRLEKGVFSEIGTGWCSEADDGEAINFDYFWEGHPVTESEYESHIAKLIDKSNCVEPAELYTKEEILELLENYIGYKGRIE